MKKVSFSEDFYKHLFDAIMDGAGDVVYDYEKDSYPDTFYVDGYAVDVNVWYGWEVHDDSFDHAFGTWHDPYPYMEAVSLDDIDDVKVRDEESDEEIEGFDYDAFMAQFEEPSCLFNHHDKEHRCYRHIRVNSGDKVLYLGKEATFLAYNNENGKMKVRTDKGTFYTDNTNIRLLTA